MKISFGIGSMGLNLGVTWKLAWSVSGCNLIMGLLIFLKISMASISAEKYMIVTESRNIGNDYKYS